MSRSHIIRIDKSNFTLSGVSVVDLLTVAGQGFRDNKHGWLWKYQ